MIKSYFHKISRLVFFTPVFVLQATVIYLTGWLLASAVAEPHPLLRDGIPFCGVDHYQPRWRPDSKGSDNRNYARRFAANLTRGEPRTVRLIYFLPNDRPYRADVVQQMKGRIREVQTFYAEQMDAHGYGKRTFRIETDAQGEPLVHRVDGRHSDSHYSEDTVLEVLAEIEEAFDLVENVYFVVIDNSIGLLLLGDSKVAGVGFPESKKGGFALASAGFFDLYTVAHELGHAFGLTHDFRDGDFIMSYGPGKRGQLSPCHADLLSVHPYFNRDTPIEVGEPSDIELLSPRTYPRDATHVPIRLRVSDPNGLHQVILYVRGTVKLCRRLSGETDTIVEFDYDGVIPSAHDLAYSKSTSLSKLLVHTIYVEAVDMDGDYASPLLLGVGVPPFVLFSEALEPLSKISGDNQHNLPNTALPVPFVVELRNLNSGFPIGGVTVTFTVTGGGGRLSVEHTETDWDGRAESVLTLGPNLGINTVEVSAEGHTVTFNAVAEDPVEIPDPKLRRVVEIARNMAPGTPIAPADMLALRRLDAPRTNISDLTGLETATNLETLSLVSNSISDISALAGLTNLTDLNLQNNNISDISPIAGLTNLKDLGLMRNSITDISALAGLTTLGRLWLSDNKIVDISPIAGLTNLKDLSLTRNSITDISALAGLTTLGRLWLSDNKIVDISPIAGLTNLSLLNLSRNAISDVSPLLGLNLTGNEWDSTESHLFGLHLFGNPLSYQSLYTHIPALQDSGVVVLFDTRTATTVRKLSGDNQQGHPGAVLDSRFVVEVRDGRNTPFEGVPVTFKVTEGGGMLNVTNTNTDANGRAESTLTLGSGTHIIEVTVEQISDKVHFTAFGAIEFDISVPAVISLIHVPLKVTAVDGAEQSIESVGDLYDALGGGHNVIYLFTRDSETQEWIGYLKPSDRGTSVDRQLTDDMGIISNLITPVVLRLMGSVLGTDGTSRTSTITLNQGFNLVGLPLNDSRISRVSDLYTLDGIGGNVSAIMHAEEGEFKTVGRAGDPGDIALTGGQGFIMIASQPATVTLLGEAWHNDAGALAAPVTHTGVEVGDTTPILALSGALVPEATGLTGQGFRVTVKNLSTKSAAAVVTAPDEGEYRLTVVDIEKGRAAMIGDTLEISAQSPNPFIGVEPMRYTVTAEDVKRSLIQLPELVAYEIPAETELLRNYPNPFNPETWIPYRLAEDAFVTLTIYDTSGQVVRTLDVGHRIAAVYESRSKAIYWDGRNALGEGVASGVYFYHLTAGDYSATRRMLILK